MNLRWIPMVLLSFLPRSNFATAPGWSNLLTAMRRLGFVAGVILAAAAAIVMLLDLLLARAGRPGDGSLIAFFPRTIVYRGYVLFTPVLFALLVWLIMKVHNFGPQARDLSFDESLQITLLTTAATAGAMVFLLFIPYLALMSYALVVGLGPHIDRLLPILSTLTLVVTVALWGCYWFSTSALLARASGLPFAGSIWLVLAIGLATFAIAYILDPIVYRLVESYW